MDIQAIKNRFGIIGNAPGLNHAISIAEKVASTNLTVLITGESGVGKEIFSHIIHQLGSRRHNPFIAVNCGAIPEGTIDSELFGHEKGAFTGATEQRKGYFETVAGGTIFLDEVAELPHGTQARLLRVLETGEFIRVGSSKVLKTDVRVIAATNVNLQQAVSAGRFREDLYYRLSTVPIYIPPLRERGEDIYLLFKKFCNDFAERHKIVPVKLTEEAKQLILKYSWPGNVRQLKNVAEQVSILAPEREVTAQQLVSIVPDIARNQLPALVPGDLNGNNTSASFSEREILYKLIFDVKKDLHDLKQFVFDLVKSKTLIAPPEHADSVVSVTLPTQSSPPSHHPVVLTPESKPVLISDSPHSFDSGEVVEESLSLAEKEKELIIKALKKHRNKRRDAAADLGISERTLYRKIKEYNLQNL
ncbi:MAG: sigma-54 dependent transcriptional regulator [Chitinophagales bacterium]|nr:sigma-54 dependent transcriptional regulator [Chitinophagales bacterium]MDW8274246.1 sigma-54 dependent transcriptional regulator [Chitinophagales bacterium]